jgi:hypothetical protein
MNEATTTLTRAEVAMGLSPHEVAAWAVIGGTGSAVCAEASLELKRQGVSVSKLLRTLEA